MTETLDAVATSANPDLERDVPGAADGLRMLGLEAAQAAGLGELATLPRAFKVLAEDILVRRPAPEAERELAALVGAGDATLSFQPGRALLQDFLGVPLMTDLAALRDAAAEAGLDPRLIDPVIPCDFVTDHSLVAMAAGRADALPINRRMEMERNRERFAFIKWAQSAFGNFRVIPPGRGIMHQINLEWLSTVVRSDGALARPDTMIGTDSHTTMVNALGVLGWGVGGIEAEMAMLGRPLEFTRPRVVGIELRGTRPAGATATDLVLWMAEFLRGIGVVGAFVEFHGPGVAALTLADRATIANMAPEYGATCCHFPIDAGTLDYLAMTGRSAAQRRRVEAYARAQGLWQDEGAAPLAYDEVHRFDLSRAAPAMAGPTRPNERRTLAQVPRSVADRVADLAGETAQVTPDALGHGSVVIAAITSCTNTANPPLMMAAGLVARAARARGLQPKPWVKTSLAPGSLAVTEYLDAAGLTEDLDALGFQTIGYGCTTCNGNSGPLDEAVAQRIRDEGLCTFGVLSGNRNFEGRIHPQIGGAYLASPPLVVAAAIAGTVAIDLANDPLGTDAEGRPVHLADLWPAQAEIDALVAEHVTGESFARSYAVGMESTPEWEEIEAPGGARFAWDDTSGFIRPSPFPQMGPVAAFDGPIRGIRPLLVLGDAVTTDHVAPNGAIQAESPAGRWLIEQGESPAKLGNFGLRRGNPEVCGRGMFDNPLLSNALASGRGNRTVHRPSGDEISVWEAGRRYADAGVSTIVIAGEGYGAGSSRDWAAKGLRLLGVVAVLAESFERIHRANLIGVGVLPLEFMGGVSRGDIPLDGGAVIDLDLPETGLAPEVAIPVRVSRDGEDLARFEARLAARSAGEVALIAAGGILPAMRAELAAKGATDA